VPQEIPLVAVQEFSLSICNKSRTSTLVNLLSININTTEKGRGDSI